MRKTSSNEAVEKVVSSTHRAVTRMEYQPSKGYSPPDTHHGQLQTNNCQWRIGLFKTVADVPAVNSSLFEK